MQGPSPEWVQGVYWTALIVLLGLFVAITEWEVTHNRPMGVPGGNESSIPVWN